MKEKDQENQDTNNTILTFITLPVTIPTYETIVNFCVDNAIENVPERKNMYYNAYTREGVYPDVKLPGDMIYYMGNLNISVEEAINGVGSVLCITGESPALEDLTKEMMKDVPYEETFIEEPNLYVILSTNIEEKLDEAHLTDLTKKLNEYLGGKLAFSEGNVRFELADDIYNFLLDGKEPTQEEIEKL